MQNDGNGAREHEPLQQVPRGADQHVAAAVNPSGIAKHPHSRPKAHYFPVKRKPLRRIASIAPPYKLSCPAKAGHPVTTGLGIVNESQVVTGSSAFADDDP